MSKPENKDVCPRRIDETACATCQNSLWYTTDLGKNCYCRVMFLIVYPTAQPILDCDGVTIE